MSSLKGKLCCLVLLCVSVLPALPQQCNRKSPSTNLYLSYDSSCNYPIVMLYQGCQSLLQCLSEIGCSNGVRSLGYTTKINRTYVMQADSIKFVIKIDVFFIYLVEKLFGR